IRRARAAASAGERRLRENEGESAGRESSAFPGESQVRDFHVHGGRAQLDRYVRSKTVAQEIRRTAASRQFRQSAQPVHERRYAAALVAVGIQEARKVRDGCFDALSAPGGVRG